MTRKSKDTKRKLKVKPSAIQRAPEKNRKEFESILSKIRSTDDDKLVIRSVEKMEGTGYFKLNDDKKKLKNNSIFLIFTIMRKKILESKPLYRHIYNYEKPN